MDTRKKIKEFSSLGEPILIPFEWIEVDSQRDRVLKLKSDIEIALGDKWFLVHKYKEIEKAINHLKHLQSIIHLSLLKHNMEGSV